MPLHVPLQQRQQSINYSDTWQLSIELLFHCLTSLWLTTHFQFKPQRKPTRKNGPNGIDAYDKGSIYVKRLFLVLFWEVCRFSVIWFRFTLQVALISHYLCIFSSLLEPFGLLWFTFTQIHLDFVSTPVFIHRVIVTRWYQVFTFHLQKFHVSSWFQLLKKKALDHWLHKHTALKTHDLPILLQIFSTLLGSGNTRISFLNYFCPEQSKKLSLFCASKTLL